MSVAVATSSEAEEESPPPSGTDETTAASKPHVPAGSIGSDRAAHARVGRGDTAHRAAARPCGNDCGTLNAEGHDKALVVISVLANQVNAPRRRDDKRSLAAKDVCKELLCLLDLLGRHHVGGGKTSG
eukprot:scaffold167293_cov35-Tisochrysis_lutea.AAC.1